MRVRFKAITPNGKIVKGNVSAAILAAASRVGERMKSDFIKTTRTWDHRVTFVSNYSSAGFGALEVYTTDVVYGYVDQGTKPHTIVSRSGGLLALNSGYRAKTTPGVLGSGSGGRTGYPVFAKAVSHPGTVARGFSEIIAKKYEPIFAAAMAAAIARAVR